MRLVCISGNSTCLPGRFEHSPRSSFVLC